VPHEYYPCNAYSKTHIPSPTPPRYTLARSRVKPRIGVKRKPMHTHSRRIGHLWGTDAAPVLTRPACVLNRI
jgi:hypothetical protein